MEHYLRYLCVVSGTGLVALGWILDKLPDEAGPVTLAALLAIAGADIYKHRDEKK